MTYAGDDAFLRNLGITPEPVRFTHDIDGFSMGALDLYLQDKKVSYVDKIGTLLAYAEHGKDNPAVRKEMYERILSFLTMIQQNTKTNDRELAGLEQLVNCTKFYSKKKLVVRA